MKYTNKFNLPRSFVDAIIKTTYDITKRDSKSISVTTLINPPRISILRLRHWEEIEEDIADSLWRILGSAVHYVMQQIPDKDRFIEEKLKEPILGYTIVGKPDMYDATDKSVIDYKVTSVWAVKTNKIEWEQQLNIYGWFYSKLGFEVKTLKINAILRDWNNSQYLQAVSKGRYYPQIPFKEIDIQLWTLEYQEQYIKERISLYTNALNLEDKELPICTEQERWREDRRCKNYCSVAHFCEYWKFKYGK